MYYYKLLSNFPKVLPRCSVIRKLTELGGRERSAQTYIHKVQGSDLSDSIVMVFYIFSLKVIILYERSHRCGLVITGNIDKYFLIFSRSVNLTFRLLFIIIIIINEFLTSQL